MLLDKIDPKFRILTDQLFFTDRTDLDLSNFTFLLEKEDEHYRYLWDRLIRSAEIFWEESFWINRFELLSSLPLKKNIDQIGAYLLDNFNKLIHNNYGASPSFNNEYIQFIAWVKVKSLRKDNLMTLREFMLSLAHTVQASKLPEIVRHFIPYLFQDMEEYLKSLSDRVGQSARSFEVLKQLEAEGLAIDKSALFKLSKNLLLKRATNRSNRRALFAMLEDISIRSYLKSEYKPDEHRPRLLELIHKCDYKEIEEYHLRNIKNLLELDNAIVDDLITTYADGLYARGTGNKGANIKRLIRVCKTYPQFSPKKVLAYLSANNKMSDIKFLVSSFHDLKLLVPFV